ncbi:MAG: DUF1178 family protein [Candidimonas sp.]|jgi:hypothetical protein
MALKVFDLQCDQAHVFEGWFSSLENYQSQQEQGLLACPVCGSGSIVKKPSAPRINMGRGQADAQPAGEADASRAGINVASLDEATLTRLQAQVLRHMRDMVRNAENVGVRFSEEARRMHEGEAERRTIRGVATREEREALTRDGIAVTAIPDFLDDDRMQ